MIKLKGVGSEMRAVVAMSGGIDSSVAAYLLKSQGYKVTGLSFELWDQRDLDDVNVCCSIKTIEIAKEVARRLDIEHYTVDVRDEFYHYIIEDFCNSYLSGRTPNPCILCNKFIKFKFLLKKAKEIGADIIATGHYARIVKPQKSDRVLLKKGIDPKKDQSYVLYVMTQDELSRSVFPLGELKKDETRRIARQVGIASFVRAESQEICFVGNRNYIDFIKELAPQSLKPGPIMNTKGEVIGEHKGVAFYTIGQRKRIGISRTQPFYVADIDVQKNTIIVGSKEDAMKRTFKVKELNWISIDSLKTPLEAMVKIRSTMKEEPAIIRPAEDQTVTVEFKDPQWAPAPGQSAVFYDNDIVIGGGIIF
jgi:tRNA-specific 2-thiouridylase